MLKDIKSLTYLLFALLVPFVVAVSLYALNLPDVIFKGVLLHSVMLVMMSILSLSIFYFSYRSYLVGGDLRTLILSLSFYIFSLSFLAHIVVVFKYSPVIFNIIENITAFFGALFFWVLLLPIPKFSEKIDENKLKIFIVGVFVSLFSLFVFLVFFPRWVDLIGDLLGLFILFVAILFLVLIFFCFSQYEKKQFSFMFYSILGFFILVNSGIAHLFLKKWSIVWWYFHFIVLLYLFIAVFTLIRGRVANQDFFGNVFGETPLYSRISTKLVLLVLLEAVIPLLLISYFFINFYRDNLEKQIIEDIVLLAETQESHLSLYLESLKHRTIDFSSDGFIGGSLKKIEQDPFDVRSVALLNAHLRDNKMPLDKNIYGINILDLDGQVVASTDVSEIGKDEKEDFYFSKAITMPYATGYADDIRVAHHFGSGRHTIAISSPLIDENSRDKMGVIVNYFDSIGLETLLSGGNQMILGAIGGLSDRRDTLEVYLVNKDKLMISDSRFRGKEGFLTQIVNTDPVKKCRASFEDTKGKWVNYHGVSVYGASMCIRDMDWILLVEIEEGEVLRPIFNLILYLSLGLLFACFVIIFSSIYFSGKLIKPLELLAIASEKIGAGDLNITVDVESDDEIGKLSEFFNKMTSDLKIAREKLKSYAFNLEKMVSGRTKELDEKIDDLEKIEKDLTTTKEELQVKIVELEIAKKTSEERQGKLIDRELENINLKEELGKLKKRL